jgi:hypothetical protein
MKKLLKIIGILAVVGILAAAYVWFFVYNKPHRDYEKASADYELDAGECYQQFVNGTPESNEYVGKVLKIYGKPSGVENNDSIVIVTFVFSEGMFGDEGIRCTMLPKYNDKALALNLSEGISIKGYCSGYNGTDVIMMHCSLVNQ